MCLPLTTHSEQVKTQSAASADLSPEKQSSLANYRGGGTQGNTGLLFLEGGGSEEKKDIERGEDWPGEVLEGATL